MIPNDGLDRIWKEMVVTYILRYYPNISLEVLEGMRKTMKLLSQAS
jgi:hypothetical protein